MTKKPSMLMNSNNFIAIMIIIIIFLIPSCVHRHEKGKPFDLSTSDNIRIGKSTRAEIVNLMGKPNKESITEDGFLQYLYDYMKIKQTAVPIFGVKDERSGYFMLVDFDDNDIVTKVDRQTHPEETRLFHAFSGLTLKTKKSGDESAETGGKTERVLVSPMKLKSENLEPEVKRYLESLNSENAKTILSAFSKLGQMRKKALPAVPFLILMLSNKELLSYGPGKISTIFTNSPEIKFLDDPNQGQFRVNVKALETLKHITGQNFYFNKVQWRNWWVQKKNAMATR
jgi:hypothetical protein